MGCGGSKLETLEPVALCKDRSILLESVIRHRYTLSNAHFSYLRSLASVGIALQRFFENISPPSLPSSTSSSYLPDQNQQKSDSVSHAEIPSVNRQSDAHSKSHMELNSDSDSVSEISTTVHEHVHGRGNDHGETLDQNPDMNYMQTRPAEPSVVYQQQSSETVRVEGDPSLSGYGFAYPNPSSYSYPYSYPYAYSNQYSYPYPYAYSIYGVGYGGYNGYSFPPQFDQSSYMPPPCLAAAPVPDSSPERAAPPQSPSPAEASWDFLDPFYEKQSYYRAYTPSRDSEELREEEGIPELEEVVEYDEIEQEQVSDVEEDDEIEQEEVKEVEEEKKTVVDGGAGGGEDLEKVADKSDAEIVVEESGDDVNLNLVEEDEIVVIEDENLHDGGGVGAAVMNAQLEVSGVLREIKAQFYIASESGNEVSKLLEVGKVPYRGRNAVYKGNSFPCCFLACSASSGSLLSVTFNGCPSQSYHSENFTPQPIALITFGAHCLILFLFYGMEFLVFFKHYYCIP